jgi:hypothetical protein
MQVDMLKLDKVRYIAVEPGMRTRVVQTLQWLCNCYLATGAFHASHLERSYVGSGEPPLSLQKISLPAIMGEVGNSPFTTVAVLYLTLPIVTDIS